jgi:hypothetical protein
MPDFDQLLDCRSATNVHVTSEQLMEVAARKLFSQTSKCAFVASTAVVFAIGRILQAYNQLSPNGSVAAVFYDMKAALGWLQRTDLSSLFGSMM